jgi:translation elongation factor P/translation initiation factor 5A
MSEYKIGQKFITQGKTFTIEEYKQCVKTGKHIYVATAVDKNYIWRGSEEELDKISKNWIVSIGGIKK